VGVGNGLKKGLEGGTVGGCAPRDKLFKRVVKGHMRSTGVCEALEGTGRDEGRPCHNNVIKRRQAINAGSTHAAEELTGLAAQG
jgi:hypothetical protein